jgi:NTE family protein
MAGVDLRYEPHLALALGGGGALGAAHCGVLEVLHERGIVPSIVVGTSAGSIAGGAFANGQDPYELSDLIRRANWGDFGTFSMTPGLGLLDTDGLRETVERIGHDSQIEDLPIRFAAVATDVKTDEAVLIDSGSLVDAMSASMAVPGLFRPKQIGGRILVDGGVVQNLPLEAAFSMGATHVIGVRLAAEWDFLPAMRSAIKVHEFEIRDDVTMITPRLRHRSQWVARDLPGLITLGREAAELALADYPVINPRPHVMETVGAEEPPTPVAQAAPPALERPRGVSAFFQRH